ncbi:MAG: ribosomal protein S18-alanine N-acetyltransferase [Lachnospiraceae bacterium]|nr:ribosomal protein S18-alanine N-acetyltransferase [Lachnospiraceae bacterium]
MLIRPMTAADAASAAALEAENFSRPWSREDFDKAAADERYLYYVAENNGSITGQAGLLISFDEAELLNVSVSRLSRRCGVAEKLLIKLFEAGRERGVERIFLEVRASNEAAIGLYEKLGFKREGVRKNFYRDPAEDALIYSLENN